MSLPRTRPLKVGLLLPHWERALDGATPRWADMLAFAQRAEAVGVDSLWVVDHLLIRRDELYERMGLPVLPGLAEAPPVGFWEGWSLLAALAAATTRVELGTVVACTGYRNPALLAKMADTLDEISGGRLILGLGAGDSHFEHQAFGVPFDQRVGRFEEALTIVRGLLREGALDYQGTYYRVERCELRPRGPRPGGPPLMLGVLASGRRMLRLAAQQADLCNAWLAYGRSQPDEIPPLRDRIDAACREHGRDPTTLARTVTIRAALFGGTVAGAEPLTGSPEELAASLRAFAREGISHVQVWLTPHTLAGVEAFAPVLELLDRG
jgi:alkanesulfonate monooxygenase SsuD/methylene tetrahydromethanopterin reductase-like flavin-dependent oxidoreductase (luciferase family)